MMVHRVASPYATQARFRNPYQSRCCRFWKFHTSRLRHLTEISFPSPRLVGTFCAPRRPFRPNFIQLLHRDCTGVCDSPCSMSRMFEKTTKLAKSGPNGAALCAAPCGRPLQRARPARPRRACPPALRTRAPPKRPTHTKGALQPTSQHVRTPITVPRTPQACSSILHDHRPDARAHKTPVQRPHPRAAMRATRSPRARHTQNVQRLPGALQQQVLLVLEHLHVEKSGLRRRGREHRHEQVRRRRRARTSRSAGSARPAISRAPASSEQPRRLQLCDPHNLPRSQTRHVPYSY